MKKALPRLVVPLLCAALAACVDPGSGDVRGSVSGDPEPGVTFVFRDGYSGEPVAGVVVVAGGVSRTSDAQGRVATGALAGSTLTGYIDPKALADLGYSLASGFWLANGYLPLPQVFSFPVPALFERVILLRPASPTLVTVSGVANMRTGGGPVSGNGGTVVVYTSSGLVCGNTDIAQDRTGNYSVDVPTGPLTFVVTEYDGAGLPLSPYYAVAIVNGDQTVDLHYTGADLALSGNGTGTGASSVYATLQIGDTPVELYRTILGRTGAFALAPAHLGQDVIRVRAQRTDGQALSTTLTIGDQFTSSQAGISLPFAAGVSLPEPWTSNLAWDDQARALTWSAAGNAVGYYVVFNGTTVIGPKPTTVTLVRAFAAGTSLTVPAAFDLSTCNAIAVLPMWSEGALEAAVPADLAGTTVTLGAAAQLLLTP
jgi:hypothetical protein